MEPGFSVFKNSLEDDIAYALQHRFRHLEISLYPKHLQLYTFTPERIAALNEKTAYKNIQYSFHLPDAFNLAHEFEYIRNKNIQFLKNCLQIAGQLKSTHITIHAGSFVGHTHMQLFRSRALQHLIKSLQTVLDSNHSHQVKIVLENTIKLHSGSEIEYLGDNIQDFITIFNQLGSPQLQMCFDIGHAHITGNIQDYIKTLGDQFFCVHVHDNNSSVDEHLDIGQGTVNWRNTLQALKSVNITGPWILECHHTQPHIARSSLQTFWADVE